ncbi:MAG: polyhydroxyalkanoic acid system family protein [Myxococcales bacterium]|nr:polyhydroxyalkanoic acid system family protein [Myxococcales bacterium]
MKADYPHSFSAEEALQRIQALTDYWSNRYGVKIGWSGSTANVEGKVKGVSFKGTVRVDETSITADIKVNFLAEKLGGKSYVDRKIKSYLDSGVPVDELDRGTS